MYSTNFIVQMYSTNYFVQYQKNSFLKIKKTNTHSNDNQDAGTILNIEQLGHSLYHYRKNDCL